MGRSEGGRRGEMTRSALEAIAARRVAWTFSAGIGAVVGIARGGVVLAALVAQRLGIGLKVIAFNDRDEANAPRFEAPKWLSSGPKLGTWRCVLRVDDGAVSGQRWPVAQAWWPAAVEGDPLVLKGKTDGALVRDVEGCVQGPRQVQ